MAVCSRGERDEGFHHDLGNNSRNCNSPCPSPLSNTNRVEVDLFGGLAEAALSLGLLPSFGMSAKICFASRGAAGGENAGEPKGFGLRFCIAVWSVEFAFVGCKVLETQGRDRDSSGTLWDQAGYKAL